MTDIGITLCLAFGIGLGLGLTIMAMYGIAEYDRWEREKKALLAEIERLKAVLAKCHIVIGDVARPAVLRSNE
jgi:hypothetical protein